MKKYLKDLLLGIYAGAAIALGGLLNIIAKTLLSDVSLSWVPTLFGSLLFPIGLTLVCYLGLNLFTGKIGYLLDKDKEYLKFLGIIYVGNIIGSLFAGFLALLVFKNVPSLYNVALAIGNKKAASVTNFQDSVNTFAGSCLCGMLVYLAVLCYKTFNRHVFKVIGIFVAIATFVYFGFDHCVANMFYFTFALKFTDPFSYLNIAIATLGNTVGAIAINALYNLIKKSTNK